MQDKKLSPKDLVFGLDIGTRNVVGTVGCMGEDGFHVVGISSRPHKSRAMLDGQIHNIGRVSEIVKEVADDLKEKVGDLPRQVCIAAAGRVLVTETTRVDYTYPEETRVTEDDLHTLDLMGIDKAYSVLKEKGSQKYHFYCVGYSVMHYYLDDDPFGYLEGHNAQTIGEDIIVTFLPEDVVDGLYEAVERAGLEVANLTLEPIAAMDLAIPEKFRMLNLALVDVGAGTSDLSITRDGSIIAYGMIPSAGDELTEALVQAYLVDFGTAERMKVASTDQEEVTYEDIMGISHTVSSKEIYKLLDPITEKITEKIAEKIIELNGDKTVAACFVVGGGGKVHEFTSLLSDKLGVVQERVALRGAEVMNDIIFEEDDVEKDPLLVTPIGICLNYYDQKNNFIMIHFNGEMMKLYDNGHLTVVDAALQEGMKTEDLFPKRGKELTFTVNGEKRMIRGTEGESASILLNGEEGSLNSRLLPNSEVTLTPSTRGGEAGGLLKDLPEYGRDLIHVDVNGKEITCPKFMEVNGSLEPPDYALQEGDEVEARDFITVGQLLSFMDEDLDPEGEILINNRPGDEETLIYDNFSLDYSPADGEETMDQAGDRTGPLEVKKDKEKGEEADQPGTQSIHVTINGSPYTLTGKSEYMFIDIFTVIDFDTNESRGRAVYTRINGKRADYTDPLKEGDSAEIGWEEK